METEFIAVKIDRASHAVAKSAAARIQKSLQEFVRDALLSSAAQVEAGSKETPKPEAPTN